MKKFGLIGYPLGHSFSKNFFNEKFYSENIDAEYLNFEIADKNSIKAQPKTKVAGGNDSQVVHKSRNGVRTVAVSMPCRYLHSSSCVLEKSDISATLELTIKLAENMQKQ